MDLGVLYKVVPLTSIIMNSPLSRAITLVIVFIILLIFSSAFNILNLDNSNIKESSNIKIENEVLILGSISEFGFPFSIEYSGKYPLSIKTGQDFSYNKNFGEIDFYTDTSTSSSAHVTYYLDGLVSLNSDFTQSYSYYNVYRKCDNANQNIYIYFIDSSSTTISGCDLGPYQKIEMYDPIDRIEFIYSSSSSHYAGFSILLNSTLDSFSNIISSQGYLIFNDINLNNTDKTPEDFDYCILTAETTNEQYLTFSIDENLIKLNEVFENPKLNDKNIIENLRIDLERVDEETSPTLTNLNLECSANKNDLKYDEDEDSSSSSSSSITLSSYSSNSYGNGSGFWANYGLTIKNWFNSFTSWVKSFFVAEEVY